MDIKAIRDKRLERLQRKMEEHDIDVIVSFKPENSFYISNFSPILYTHPVIAILPRKGAASLLIHGLRHDHALQSTWLDEINLFGMWANKTSLSMQWEQALAKVLGDLGVSGGRVGVEENFLPLGHINKLNTALPGATLVDGGDIILHSRVVKDALEIKHGRIAGQIADVGMEVALKAMAERKSEREVSIRAMAAMNEEWNAHHPDIEVHGFGSLEAAVHNTLWCWVLYGERVLLNCDNPTPRTPVEGEMGMILVWATCNGIFSENERGVAIGSLSDERRRNYDSILAIRQKAFDKLRPGVPVRDVYQAARDEYVAQGLESRVTGRIGHSIGLGLHEHPALDPQAQETLEPGMMFTIEPALRVPEWGGFQHSDTVLITETGFEYMNGTRRDYIQL